MKFRRLVIRGFGPYKDEETIVFPEAGVVAVYGENMRGKTTLLNAIRFALYGKIMNRRSREVDIHNYVNEINRMEKRFGFEITLEMEHDGTTYELTRKAKPRDPKVEPKSQNDYNIEIFLKVGKDILGTAAAVEEIRALMPEEISRFFLFDGELLGEYEKLLDDESGEGDKIKEAIEGILGVPVLMRSRDHVRQLLTESQRQATRIAEEDKRTQTMAVNLRSCETLIQNLESNIRERTKLRREKQDQRAAVEETLQKNQRARDLIERRNDHQRELRRAEEQERNLRQTAQELLGDAWRSVLADPAAKRRADLEEKLPDAGMEAPVRDLAERLVHDGMAKRDCPLCGSRFNKASEQQVRELAAKPGPDENTRQVIKQIDALKQFRPSSSHRPLARVLSDIRSAQLARVEANARLEEITRFLSGIDETSMAKLAADLRALDIEIDGLRRGLDADNAELSKQEDLAKKYRKAIDAAMKDGGTGQAGYNAANAKVAKLEAAHQFFTELVDTYRERLKRQIEKSASEIFSHIITERDFTGLEMNDRYGLTIRHRDGHTVQIRSAGAEQVVALALLGALHNNAPIKGPVIMDTTFARLDKGHVKNILQYLPELTAQSMILVQSNEVEPELVQKYLKSGLKEEYELTRVEARQTKISPRRRK